MTCEVISVIYLSNVCSEMEKISQIFYCSFDYGRFYSQSGAFITTAKRCDQPYLIKALIDAFYGLLYRLQTAKTSFLLRHVLIIDNMSCRGSVRRGSDVKTMYPRCKKYTSFQVFFTCITYTNKGASYISFPKSTKIKVNTVLGSSECLPEKKNSPKKSGKFLFRGKIRFRSYFYGR